MSGKLPGLLLIAGAALWSASAYLRCCRSRIRKLASLALLLELMQGELQSAAPPLEQLLVTLRPRLDGNARDFAASVSAGMGELGKRSFSEIWNTSLHTCFPELSEAERRELETLGSVLGRYELSRQLEAIARCRGFLKQSEQREASALREKTRLSLGLALTAAALLGIVLV
ncbi:MAG: stage III sporulation protein AB [Oscillospiraceae bacterium]|nr:stage III sporulation protein AB [Oscillospiraceae bacterium]